MGGSMALASETTFPAPAVALDSARTKAPRPRPVPAIVCGMILALMVLIPFVVAAARVPLGYHFRGTLKPSGDESQYLAAVAMGHAGAWLWHDPYMAHPPPPILMYPLYLAAGHLAALFDLSVPAGFALLHVLAVPLLYGALWRLAAVGVPRAARPWFVAFALGAAGLYWLVAVLATVDWAPTSLSRMGSQDLSGFTGLLMEAHEALGVAGGVMLLGGLLGVARPHGRVALNALYGACGMTLAGLALPVVLPVLLAMSFLFSVWWIWRGARPAHQPARRVIGCAAISALPGLAFAAYYYLLFSRGPWAGGQFRAVPAVPVVEQFLLWGWLLPLALWGWWRAGQDARPAATALALWAGGALLGSRLPFWQGPRYTAGMPVILGALFALGLLETAPHGRALRRWLCALSLGAVCQYLYLLSALAGGHAPYLYSTAAEDAAARWLAIHAGPEDVVLAPLGFANVLPTAGPVRVVAGHDYQTLDMTTRRQQLLTFYGAGAAPAVRLRALRASGATLVVYDPLDLEDGAYDPRALPGLHLVYRADGVAIWRLARAGDTRR